MVWNPKEKYKKHLSPEAIKSLQKKREKQDCRIAREMCIQNRICPDCGGPVDLFEGSKGGLLAWFEGGATYSWVCPGCGELYNEN